MARTRKNILLTSGLVFLLVCGLLLNQGTDNPLVGIFCAVQGNAAYRVGAYGDAEVYFRKALHSKIVGCDLRYNLGNALYQQGRYVEAAQQYKLTLQAGISLSRAQAWANLANAFYQSSNLAGSYAAYRNALLLCPGDNSIRQDFLFVRQQFAAKLKGPEETRRVPPAHDEEEKEAKRTGGDEDTKNDTPPGQGGPEQKLSDKNMEEIFGLINDNENKARGLMNGTGPKAKKLASDEKDY